VVLLGSGAANIAAAHLLIAAGFREGNIVLADSKGVLHPEREDMDSLMLNNPWKYQLALKTNSGRIKGDSSEAFKGADVIISASKQGPDTIKQDWIGTMNDKAIVFALANPTPEIWPSKAKEAGASIVATGRSDFPNQINNSLVFPGVFRGVLDARAKGVNFKIMVAASYEIADFVKNPGEEKIVPTMDDWELYPSVAAAVASKTVEMGLARKSNSKEGFYRTAHELIEENRNIYLKMMNEKMIRSLPGGNKIER
jgi:malate dehydrogenase (oxaloacetate-decarboxylating)